MHCSFFIDRKTGSGSVAVPDRPDFTWELNPTENGLTEVRVKWLPNFTYNKPGSHFYARYRIKGTTRWIETDAVIDDDFVYIRGLQPDDTYEFSVVSVDGDKLSESEAQEVTIPENGNVTNKKNVFVYLY